jgi:hypothetical protein
MHGDFPRALSRSTGKPCSSLVMASSSFFSPGFPSLPSSPVILSRPPAVIRPAFAAVSNHTVEMTVPPPVSLGALATILGRLSTPEVLNTEVFDASVVFPLRTLSGRLYTTKQTTGGDTASIRSGVQSHSRNDSTAASITGVVLASGIAPEAEYTLMRSALARPTILGRLSTPEVQSHSRNDSTAASITGGISSPLAMTGRMSRRSSGC